jgi:hypothetical protein
MEILKPGRRALDRTVAHGFSLLAQPSRRSSPWHGDGVRVPGMLATWSPRAVHARDGAVAHLLAALWRLAGEH